MTERKRILDMVKSPADVKCLTDEELEILCRELREEMVEVTSQTGGHLASSLGAVEIIVALHSLLNCPDDKIVFDVGHQAYAHKLLTGRREAFKTLRQLDGLTGFPNPDESLYDAHPSGHASDSLSVAMGLAKARDMQGGTNNVVAVIGDSSLAGGMAFEALNHIGQDQTRMVIVLNDNGMSISKPVGALVRHLGYLRTRTEYRQTRDALQQVMESGGLLSRGLVDLGRNMKESMKQFVIPHAMIFEQLGITCTAPVDGHDVATLRQMFRIALESDGPVLVHVITQKGHGYGPSERNPEKFHGVSPFDIATGEAKKKAPSAPHLHERLRRRPRARGARRRAHRRNHRRHEGRRGVGRLFEDLSHTLHRHGHHRRACGRARKRPGRRRHEAGRGHLFDLPAARLRPDRHRQRPCRPQHGLRDRPRRHRG
jgi:1-deoxy-D-xylulose-5-phosphate synthase